MATTRVMNIGFGAILLPAPYNHIILAEGGSVMLAVAKATVLADFGGVDAIRGIFQLTENDTLTGLTKEEAASSELYVGISANGYTPPNNAWAFMNGIDPLTVPAIRFIDQATGAMHVLTSVNGVLNLA
jgi:hypothetical protein